MAKVTTNRGKSPFRDKVGIRDEVVSYLNKFRTTVSFHGKKISTYFEMNCYTYIVKFYERNGYTVQGAHQLGFNLTFLFSQLVRWIKA